MPGYAEMTKKKGCHDETPGKGMKKSVNRDWPDFDRRNFFDGSETHSEKEEMSTCQNFPIDHQPQDGIRCLGPLQNHEL